MCPVSKVAEEILRLAFAIAAAEEVSREKKPREEAKLMGYTYAASITVEGLTIIDFVSGEPHARLFSIEIYNDGPDEVYASVNNYQRNAPIKPGESLKIDMRLPRIESLFLDVANGRKAFIRVFGIY
jgi:hypothetical protein